MIQKPRGTMDILPEEIPYFRFIEDTARKNAEKYGFKEIRFPTFEFTELFQRGVGNSTDVVQKEMYTFADRDEERTLTLRPEGTASTVRAIIENGRTSDPMPLKLYYLISCFRHEKPQAGRSREFYQFGIEMFGAGNAAADISIIALGNSFIKDLGIKGAKLHINSIGCPNCRPNYHKALKEYFASNSDDLCDTCKGRLETNPMRILDCKSPICSKIAEAAPKSIEYLCDECAEHFEILKKGLTDLGIEYELNTKLVRGLDYYTRTVFEFVSDIIGAQSAIGGGGRYDGLMQEVGGPQMPGIGFAMGITRLKMAMEASGVEVADTHRPAIYIAPMGQAAQTKAMLITEALRADGIYAEYDIVGRSLKAQMKYADKKNARYTLIIGDSELESGKAQLKDMENSSQSKVDINNIEALKEILVK